MVNSNVGGIVRSDVGGVAVRSGMSENVSEDEMSSIFEYTVLRSIVGGGVFGGRTLEMSSHACVDARSGVL